MNVSIVVAMDERGIIGANGGLPWHLSADLKHFKQITMGKPVIMGRKTHESIGRPLPGRENIVITRDTHYTAEGCTVLHSLDEVMTYCSDQEEVMIMGGAAFYRQALDRTTRIYLTEVHACVEGDTFFPALDRSHWKEVDRQDFQADEKNEYAYSFVVLEKQVSTGHPGHKNFGSSAESVG
ncbi:MAG: dihydrofolate reductase, partial [Gammaproteobacteria bacterium]